MASAMATSGSAQHVVDELHREPHAVSADGTRSFRMPVPLTTIRSVIRLRLRAGAWRTSGAGCAEVGDPVCGRVSIQGRGIVGPHEARDMDLNYSPEETAFRNEVRGLDSPEPARRAARQGAQLPRAHEGTTCSPGTGRSPGRAGSRRSGRRVGRHRLDGGAALHLRGGVRARPARRRWSRSACGCARRCCCASAPRAEAAVPAAHLQRRRLLGAGLFRARLRLRPGVAQDPRRP
jgi:hypothetical protein